MVSITMRELRHHLQKFTMMIIPDQEKPAFWRFYDPRNIWEIADTLEAWQKGYSVGIAGNNKSNKDMGSENTTITPKSKPEKWVIIPKLKRTESEYFINFGD